MTPVPEAWLSEHGDFLFRFALARVGQTEAAEDLVQETLLAALQSAATFAGRSAERTWLTGILKNKLIDRLRRGQRTRAASELAEADDWLEALYDRRGHWEVAPGRWGVDPAVLLERREFWEAFASCCDLLPERLRLVLSLRLLDDVPAADICAALAITPANLWTLLHRARVRLWNCLDGKGLVARPGEGAS